MWYLGIDQHACQITISLRNDSGDVVQARQERAAVSTTATPWPQLPASVDIHRSTLAWRGLEDVPPAILSAMTLDKPSRRRWFQFRLRTLLLLVSLVSVGLGWLAYERKKVRERREWLSSFEKAGSIIEYSSGAHAQPAWMRMLLGDDSTGDVISLYIPDSSNSKVTDAGLANLTGLTKLEYLNLEGTKVTDAGLVHLADLTNLEVLCLDNTQISNAGLAHLTGLTKLHTLWLKGSQVTDPGLLHLTGIATLRDLRLDNTQVTDIGLAQIASLTQLEDLWLNDTRITDIGLTYLAGLTKLQYLSLNNTRVTDAGVASLKGLSQLHFLDLSGTQTTPTRRQELRLWLPQAGILPDP